MRRVASVILLVLAGVLLPLAIIANWAWGTVFESETFSQRAVAPLDSQSVRRELAKRLTEQLVLAGNQQANSFRPGVEVALEGAIDTDTFRSIFRNAVERTHESILAGRGGGDGLNLADSFAILTGGLQSPGDDPSQQQGKEGLNNSLTDVTQQFDDLGIWELDETIQSLTILFFVAAVLAAIGGILLAPDRRRAARRLGVAIVAGGVFIVVLLFVANWFVGRQISDAELSGAIQSALSRVTDDLRMAGIWVAVYGIIIAAAATDAHQRFTPPEVWRRVRGWFERRRQTTAGTVLLAVLGLLASVLLVQDPLGNLELLIRAAGLWIGYLAITEVLRLVRTVAARADRRRAVWPRVAMVAGALVVIVAVVTTAFVVTSRSSSSYAEESGEQRCNGDAALCDLTIDQVTFPGSHNSMSSSQYPGFLFAEQIGTIGSQLNAGVHALLIDTHYGVPSTSRVPGADTPLILTDRVGPPPDTGEASDAESAERASRLASRAQRAADAQRDIYLCHNHCELGAVKFSSVLEDVASYLDTNPDEVVMLVIQDETSPADTAAAIKGAGLGKRVATLTPGQPLPTLRELIDKGRTLLVFSEVDIAGAPPWYHAAYEWFQETPYKFDDKDAFNCRSNRGPTTAPLFLVNHWISRSPPNPSTASAANSPEVLRDRIERCIAQRGIAPNVVAVDFAELGGLVQTVSEINQSALDEQRASRRTKKQPDRGGTDRTPRAVITTAPVGDLPPPADPTAVEQLTGGDPVRFCPTIVPALRTITSWAEAVLVGSPGDIGVADLVYGPLLRRDVKAYVDTAPNELAERAQPILDRADAAIETLRTLGFDGDEIKELASSVAEALDAPARPDGASVSAYLTPILEKKVEERRVREIAVVFASGQPDPATLLDLGFVPQEVGAASGFDCAPILASI